MIIRSRAPLRIGLAGGGTDVSPYADLFGGSILNATISMYAHANIEPRQDGKIVLQAIDKGEEVVLDSAEQLEIDGRLDLLKGVYNRVVRDYVQKPLSFTLTTYVDAPPGSGLGSSSTLVVAVLGAFAEWFNLPLGEYDLAHLAYEIERIDLAMAGGRQDQYAATFGGFNFMEFYGEDKVIVNPLRIKRDYTHEMEACTILYYTNTSRVSSKIIETQTRNVEQKDEKSVDAMHKLKEQAVMMKEALLMGELDRMGQILDFGWQHKKQMAQGITNPEIDKIYDSAMEAGASGGKVSGAGGGGFIMFYCPGTAKHSVVQKLATMGGRTRRFNFTEVGLTTWKI